MRELKRRLALLLVLSFSFVPVMCTHKVGPFLWHHQSSAAFTAVGWMWFLSIAVICGAIYLVCAEWSKP